MIGGSNPSIPAKLRMSSYVWAFLVYLEVRGIRTGMLGAFPGPLPEDMPVAYRVVVIASVFYAQQQGESTLSLHPSQV